VVATKPQTATLQIVQAQAPQKTSTHRIEAALNALLADQCGGNGSSEPH
jgi:hypothetical protein